MFVRIVSALVLVTALTGFAGLATKSDSPATEKRITPQHYGWITGLKKEKAAYYKELHAKVWPGVLKKLKECNIQSYSIYMKEIKGELYLFSYLQYTGTDWSADMAKMAADTCTQRWWKETDPCQDPLPGASAKKKIWDDMEEVFFMD